MRRLLISITLLASAVLCQAGSPDTSVDRVVVYKSQRKLVLLSNGREVKTFTVALGAAPNGPKLRQGDHRTPEGTYTLDGRNPNSQYYKAYHISYPSPEDLAAAHRRGLNPGGDIMLHGLPNGYRWVGKAHLLKDWTEGCIAVTDEEMDEIWSLVPVGTPIDIKP